MAKELHKILFVEDEPDIQAVAQLALEAVGGFKSGFVVPGRRH